MDLSVLAGADPGGHRKEGSVSGRAILAAFIPTFITALFYLGVFAAIRNRFARVYAPRTFLGTIPEKHRTPESSSSTWLAQFRSLSDHFVLQHNSLDAYLFLRFLRFIIWVCFLGCCVTFPILMPLNATGGGSSSQLDRISFSNIAKNGHLWGHTVVAWVLFLGLMAFVAWERLRVIGIRQAYYLSEMYPSRVSARTVLFMNVPVEACQTGKLQSHFGEDAVRCWPSKDVGDLPELVEKRASTAEALESAQFDLSIKAAKSARSSDQSVNGADNHEGGRLIPKMNRPTARNPPVVGRKYDKIDHLRDEVIDLTTKIDAHRSASGRAVPGKTSVFVLFTTQAAAHRAFQTVSFQPSIPLKDRFLAPRPKEVLWNTITMSPPNRVSKASLGLTFVVAFTIFFAIPVGIIGTISNVEYLADQYEWLAWVKNLPSPALALLSGFLPPFLVSWFTSYVPKLFRHIAKLSGEPTTAQAELKTQAWFFAFQVIQVFLVTTFSSGVASVAAKIAQHPDQTPQLLAENLPKASNFYLTYFIIQGTASAADNILDYSELFEYLFYEHIWNKTPREKFGTYAQMRGTPWASWFPKFTNFLVIATVYSTIAPLVLGFATVGIYFYYLSYRYGLLYVRQTKTDTRGEAYKRALQQIPTGVYLAELCLIGLFGSRKAAVQTALIVVLLVLTAVANFVLDRMLKPLELYLGIDIWEEQETLLAGQDGADTSDPAALHAASHGRRLGLSRLPRPGPKMISDFLDGIITSAREDASGWIADSQDGASQFAEDELKTAYINPALTSKTPKLWIPRDVAGASKQEIEQNEAAGIPTTDEGAEIDESGHLQWDHRFENVPIWKEAKVW